MHADDLSIINNNTVISYGISNEECFDRITDIAVSLRDNFRELSFGYVVHNIQLIRIMFDNTNYYVYDVTVKRVFCISTLYVEFIRLFCHLIYQHA